MKSFFNIIDFGGCYSLSFVTFCIFVKNHWGWKSIWNVSITRSDAKTLPDLPTMDTMLPKNEEARVSELCFRGLSTSRKYSFVYFCKNLEIFFLNVFYPRQSASTKSFPVTNWAPMHQVHKSERIFLSSLSRATYGF